MGVADATVFVKMGPFVPLLPIMRWHFRAHETKTLYPTGQLRGCWTLSELAYLEESGRGHVERFHRVVTFDRAAPYAPVVSYLRRMEPLMAGVRVKRLEHMLYGACARGLTLCRFGTTRNDTHPLPTDLLDGRTAERFTSRVEMKPFGLPGRVRSALPMFEVKGQLSAATPVGVMDRPDRSAWITSDNRVAMSRLIDKLDGVLKPERSGEYIGRVYVDGLDIEADVSQIPKLEGVSVRHHGRSMRIYRAGVYVARLGNGKCLVEDAGLLNDADGTVKDLEVILQHQIDPDSGPLAGGRHWAEADGFHDPRLLPGRFSQPLHMDLSVVERLGFSGVDG
jgi:hypothetical protein